MPLFCLNCAFTQTPNAVFDSCKEWPDLQIKKAQIGHIFFVVDTMIARLYLFILGARWKQTLSVAKWIDTKAIRETCASPLGLGVATFIQDGHSSTCHSFCRVGNNYTILYVVVQIHTSKLIRILNGYWTKCICFFYILLIYWISNWMNHLWIRLCYPYSRPYTPFPLGWNISQLRTLHNDCKRANHAFNIRNRNDCLVRIILAARIMVFRTIHAIFLL